MNSLLRAGLASGFVAVACSAYAAAELQPRLVPDRPSAVYAMGEEVAWTASLGDPAAAPAGFTYTIKRDGQEIIQSGKITVTPAGARIECRSEMPAMLYLELTPDSGSAKPVAAGAAVSPEKLRPSADCPADFDTFWQQKLSQLQQIPMEPVVTPGESGHAGVEYATVRLNSVHGAHVYGQIAKPAGKGKLPAMLVMQWASPPYPLQKSWVTDRAADGWLVMNVEPHDVPCDLPAEFYAALPQMIKEYRLIYDDDRDRNYFLQMYLGDYRALDYLTGRSDWDGRTLVVTGTSMGGQQSVCVAGLHPKVTHVIVHEPAGADSNAWLHGRADSYPNWNHDSPRVMSTALYFDTVNFAARVKAACLVSVGFVDTTARPTGIWTMFNQLQGPKEIAAMTDAPHNNLASEEQQRPFTVRAKEWMDALVRGRPVPPRR